MEKPRVPKFKEPMTAKRAQTIAAPGRYAAGNNLYLFAQQSADGERLAKFWVFRYRSPLGRRRDAGIGPYPTVTLAEATAKAVEWRRMVKDGRDPILARREQRDALRAAEAEREAARRRKGATLERLARTYHETHAPTLANAKHAAQWLSSLERHVFTALGAKPISEITTEDLEGVLFPLRDTLPETAARVRQRLDAIFADAVEKGHATRNLAAAIKPRMRVKRGAKEHHRSLPYREVPGFVVELRAAERVGESARLAFEFLIVTAARTGEVLGATWAEIDEAAAEWKIPGRRMKSGKAHRVLLPARALAIVKQARTLGGDPYLFPSPTGTDRPLSNMVFLMALRRMGYGERTTTHGFRSAFSGWAREQTRIKVAAIEAALAHREDDQVAAAYASQAEYLKDRRALAEAWARHVSSERAKVVALTAVH